MIGAFERDTVSALLSSIIHRLGPPSLPKSPNRELPVIEVVYFEGGLIGRVNHMLYISNTPPTFLKHPIQPGPAKLARNAGTTIKSP